MKQINPNAKVFIFTGLEFDVDEFNNICLSFNEKQLIRKPQYEFVSKDHKSGLQLIILFDELSTTMISSIFLLEYLIAVCHYTKVTLRIFILMIFKFNLIYPAICNVICLVIFSGYI
jgi:hypothetical protein